MRSRLLCILSVVTAVCIAPLLSASPVNMNLRITQNGSAARPADTNFRLWLTAGFSVFQQSGNYYFNGATHQRRAWKSTGHDMWDLELNPNCGADCNYSTSDPCNPSTDPWSRPTTALGDARCGDSTGMWFISTNPSSTNWYYYPGGNTAATPTAMPPRPQPGSWPYQWPTNWQLTGIPNFKQTTDATKINAAITSPIKPAADPGCTRLTNNANFAATGAANSKAVYYNGVWYMAFNETVNNPNPGWNASDTWRILWATSTDGQNWTIRPDVLFRSTRESTDCGSGLLVTQLFIDNGYFYIVANNLQTDWVTLFRAPINQAYTQGFADGTWKLATDAGSGHWSWTTAGSYLDLDNSVPHPAYIMAGPTAGVKQAAIARVFTNSAANSPSRLVGVSVQCEGNPCVQFLKVWTAADLEGSGFVDEGRVDVSKLAPFGLNGFEFAFTGFTDNNASTPRIVGNELDFWLIGDFSAQYPADSPNVHNMTAYRTTATLSGGIYSKRISLRTYYNNYVSAANGGGSTVNSYPTTVGPNETFTIIDQNGGTLNDGDPVSLQAANGMYVVADGGGCSTCTVYANRDGAAQWETFTIKKMNGTGTINTGDSIALQSYYGYWVVAENGGNNVINANRTSPAQWETFTLTEQP